MTRGVLCSNIMNRLREGGGGVYICKGEGGQDIIHRPHPNCSLLMYIDRNMNNIKRYLSMQGSSHSIRH